MESFGHADVKNDSAVEAVEAVETIESEFAGGPNSHDVNSRMMERVTTSLGQQDGDKV